MTLRDILSNKSLTISELRNLWLVMPYTLGQSLLEKQEKINAKYKISPIFSPDSSKAIICSDVISEINGYFNPLFSILDDSKFIDVQVIELSELKKYDWFNNKKNNL